MKQILMENCSEVFIVFSQRGGFSSFSFSIYCSATRRTPPKLTNQVIKRAGAYQPFLSQEKNNKIYSLATKLFS